MDLGIKGKKALVMGSSQGIGRAIAEVLIAEGAKVAICARDAVRLSQVAKEIGAVCSVSCDLSKTGSGKKLVQDVIEKLGGIDILVCNTGGPPKGGIQQITDQQWLEGFQNLWMSTVDSIQACLPSMMQKKWGRIVLVTSVSGKEAMSGLTISNGLRAGLHGLARSISHEVAAHGITINSVLPGFTDTERLRELGISDEKIRSLVPAGRMANPKEVAELAVFFASERAAYITGQTVACDGGYLKGL